MITPDTSPAADLDPTTDQAPVPEVIAPPAPEPEPTAADLAAALARADSQLAGLEADHAAAREAHRRASHNALIAGKDAPPPPKESAAALDRLEALRAVRADLAARHSKRLVAEQQQAGEVAHAKAAKLTAEHHRRWLLALAFVRASHAAFLRITGQLPEDSWANHELPRTPKASHREQTLNALGALRNKLPEPARGYVDTDMRAPLSIYDAGLLTVAENHLADYLA